MSKTILSEKESYDKDREYYKDCPDYPEGGLKPEERVCWDCGKSPVMPVTIADKLVSLRCGDCIDKVIAKGQFPLGIVPHQNLATS